MKLTKAQRAALRDKYGGKCAYCGCELSKLWHADHIEAVKREFNFIKRGGYSVPKCTGVVENPHLDTLENLNPSCPQCNNYKHSGSLESFRTELSYQVGRARRASANFRFAEKYGQITITESPIVFYFETFEKEQLNDNN